MAQDRSFIGRSFASLDRFFERPGAWLGAVGVLAAIQFALIWMHRPWSDELQALLIASEARSPSELLAWLRYEGHPPAWYVLLAALAALVPEPVVLPLAATLCAFVVQGIIIFASPFTRSERLLLASSQYVLFEFLTISRGTSLGVALLMLAVLAWRSRSLWAIMALLPFVDFLFGVISGVFLILKWRERELWWPGVILWLAGSALAAVTVFPPADMVSANDAMNMATGPMVWLTQMGSLPIPFQGGINPQWNTPVAPIAPIGWVLMLVLAWTLTSGHTWHRLLVFGFFGFTFAFSLAIYPIGLRHLMLGALLLILLVWLQRSAGDAPRLLFRGWLVVLALCGLATGAISTTRGFDRGPEVVAEIERLGLEDKHWIVLPEWRLASVTGRSDMGFERPEQRCTLTFVPWDHYSQALQSRAALTDLFEREIAEHGRTYLLSDRPFEGFEETLLRPLYASGKGYNGLGYYLYVIGPQEPEKTVDLPSCHRRP